MSYSDRAKATRMEKERDEAQAKLKIAQTELSIQTSLFEQIVSKINKENGDESLTFCDFMDYFNRAVGSDEEIFAEQFSTLLMTAKLFFGEELHAVHMERQKAEQARLAAEAVRMEHYNEYRRDVAERSLEKRECITRRTKIIEKIARGNCKIDDFDDTEQLDILALTESKNIKESYWFNRLIVLSYDNIPLDRDNDYYEGYDHPHCPHYIRIARIFSRTSFGI